MNNKTIGIQEHLKSMYAPIKLSLDVRLILHIVALKINIQLQQKDKASCIMKLEI